MRRRRAASPLRRTREQRLYPAVLTADARTACTSYGLAAGTASYDRCVSREVDTRTYRNGPQGPTYYTDQNGNRIVPSQNQPGSSVPPYRRDLYNNRIDAEGYRVDSSGNRMAVQGPYYNPTPQASSSQAVSRDEFGNRYDAQGNRIDASGRTIVMPQSRY